MISWPQSGCLGGWEQQKVTSMSSAEENFFHFFHFRCFFNVRRRSTVCKIQFPNDFKRYGRSPTARGTITRCPPALPVQCCFMFLHVLHTFTSFFRTFFHLGTWHAGVNARAVLVGLYSASSQRIKTKVTGQRHFLLLKTH